MSMEVRHLGSPVTRKLKTELAEVEKLITAMGAARCAAMHRAFTAPVVRGPQAGPPSLSAVGVQFKPTLSGPQTL